MRGLAYAALVIAGWRVPAGLDIYMPVPEENPLTREKIAIGRRLFFDRRLSRDRTLSCATCHEPKRAFTDGRAVAAGLGGNRGTRNTPTLVNRGYGWAHFWDGRAPSLEKQVLEPILSPKELSLTVEELSVRVRMSSNEVARALATYVRSIRSGDSPFDRYINGKRSALTPQQQQGLALFRGKGNCTACHAGPNFTDERFHNTGVAWRDNALLDPGRFTVTGNPSDRGAFKTPTLREVARTMPYMHDGSLATLEDVIDYYDRGGNVNPGLDRDLRPLKLAPSEKQALIAFLRSLSGKIHEGL